MVAFTYRLERKDGTPADPPTFRSAPRVSWPPGDRIPLGARMLRVVAVRGGNADQAPVLVVEDAPNGRTAELPPEQSSAPA
jgi:hypothetical protein